MRPWCLALISLFALAPVAGSAASAAVIGPPTQAFALSWTSLPTGDLTPLGADAASATMHAARMAPVADERMSRLLDDAFASAADTRTRADIAFDEMLTPWDQPQRSAFQRLREAEAAYAGDAEARRDRFAILLSGVVGGTGRSVARDGLAAAALAGAYDAALARQDGAARAGTEAGQKMFVAYRAAFVAFADGLSPGTGAGVADALDRQRAADLAR